MRKNLMDILCCPICKSDLHITAIKENEFDIIDGNLSCNKCNRKFIIKDEIPHMLATDDKIEFTTYWGEK